MARKRLKKCAPQSYVCRLAFGAIYSKQRKCLNSREKFCTKACVMPFKIEMPSFLRWNAEQESKVNHTHWRTHNEKELVRLSGVKRKRWSQYACCRSIQRFLMKFRDFWFLKFRYYYSLDSCITFISFFLILLP